MPIPYGPAGGARRTKTLLAYDYKDAVTLLTDFRSDVEAVLKEFGVMK